MTMGLVYHEDYLQHETGEHPEHKDRLTAILNHLRSEGLLKRLAKIMPRPATVEEIALVHDPNYIRKVKATAAGGGGYLDPDTIVAPESYEVALLAAGGVLQAVYSVIDGEVPAAMCLVRPPGHHAEADHGMGFCLFNNVAVAARYAQRRHGLQRIMIIDWDVHHGNGTQHSFEAEREVLFFSIHQSPLYPGTGRVNEVGQGKGAGFTVNVPLPSESGDGSYYYAFKNILMPIAQQYEPQLILVSAGYDAHRDDPLANMRLSTAGFNHLADMVGQMARELCGGKVVLTLEGGYNREVLATAVAGTINIIGGYNPDLLLTEKLTNEPVLPVAREKLELAIKTQQKHWKLEL